jgi:hypothetical protein
MALKFIIIHLEPRKLKQINEFLQKINALSIVTIQDEKKRIYLKIQYVEKHE